MKLGEVCEHGSLKRQCHNCELMAEIDQWIAKDKNTESQLQAADALAKAMRTWRDAVNAGSNHILADIIDPVDEALAAYEKLRGK